ncbi:MAG: HK97 gp10 family phage protein [Micrococcaceae bacterium]|nr:HK97 gp10 family phage protein [Micrococcaceae bacterium]
MAKGIKIDLEGLSGLQAALGDAEQRITAELQSAVEVEAQDIENDAKSHVRVDSGDLQDSIQAEVGDMSSDVAPRSGALEGDYEKAMVNEFGRSRDPGQPYMVPAAEASRARWPQRAADAVQRGVDG